MAHILSDRVRETTTTTGTGAIALGGAVANFRDFDTLMANTDTTNYAIVHRTVNEWEVGRGTWNTGNTLSRSTVYAGTNGTSAVNLSAGTKDIFMTYSPLGEQPGLLLSANSAIVWPGGSPAIAESGGVELLLSTSVTGDNIRLDTGGADRVEINGILTGNADSPVILRTTTTAGGAMIIPAGTLMTTPTDGMIEADATNFYGTTDAGNRGYIPARHLIVAEAARTYTSNTSSQSIFNVPTNGRITLETGLYRFEANLVWTTMSATSGNRSVNILGAGTATVVTPRWVALGFDGAPNTAGAAGSSFMTAVGSPASVVTATIGTSLGVHCTGTFQVTVAGTMIPSTAMVTAAASVLGVGSSWEIWRIGATNRVSVGQWD